MDSSQKAIIQRIEEGYNKIVRLYLSVPVTALLEPFFMNGWSVKDLLTHIAAWEWRCEGLLHQSHDSNVPLQAQPDIDALNEEIYQEHKEWSWTEVDHDFREAHIALLAALRALPVERLNDPVMQQAIAVETWEHYEEHLPQLEDWHRQAIKKQ